jgi:hypothetical protein
VPLRHYRLDHRRRGDAYEIPVDFFSSSALTEFLLWTSLSGWMRVKLGAGAYQWVGNDRTTAVDLGAFSAGETKQGTIEVTVPLAANTRHESLALNLGGGL